MKKWKLNYTRLSKIVGMDLNQFVEKHTYLKLASSGYMDLSVDVLGNNKIAIAHNYTQNGDLMCDPDMQILILPKLKMVQAYTYQQDGLGIYQESLVFDDNGKPTGCRERLFNEHNSFLGTWLRNIISQGHKPVEVEQ